MDPRNDLLDELFSPRGRLSGPVFAGRAACYLAAGAALAFAVGLGAALGEAAGLRPLTGWGRVTLTAVAALPFALALAAAAVRRVRALIEDWGEPVIALLLAAPAILLHGWLPAVIHRRRG